MEEFLIKNRKILIFLIFLYAFLILPSEMPNFYPMFIDSGLYSYIAQRIKEGEILYKDVWEIKFPAIYYIYTFLFTIFPESRWTLYFSDIFLFLFTLSVIYLILKNLKKEIFILPFIPVFITVYRVYPSFSGGNLNEHYFLFFFFLCFYFITKSELKKIDSFLFGISFFSLFLFKQHYIIFPLALLALYKKKILENFKFFISGVLIPFLFFLYVMIKGYPESIDCTILYPLYWSRKTNKNFSQIIGGFKGFLKYGPLLPFIILFLILLFPKKVNFKKDFFVFSLISILILGISPVSHPHYSLILIIPFILGFLVLIEKYSERKIILFLLLLFTFLPLRFIYARTKHSMKSLKTTFVDRDLRCTVNPVAFTIINHLKIDERFIMLPSDPTIYFLTKTKSSFRFTNFDYFIPDYYKEELRKLIREKPPDYVYLDRPVEEFERIFSLNKNEYKLTHLENNLYKFEIVKSHHNQ